MPTEDVTRLVQLEELKTVLNTLRDSTPEDLEAGRNLGPFNFSKYREQFAEIFEFASDLYSLPLEHLAIEEIESWKSSVTALYQQFEAINEFDPEAVDSPSISRDSLATSVIEHFRNLKGAVRPQLPYLILKREPTDLKTLKKKAESAASDIQVKVDEAVSKLEEIESILKSSRSAVAQVGVDVHSEDFSTIAQDHKDSAKNWLISTVVLICLAVLAPIVFIGFFPLNPNVPLIVNIQLGLTKLAIIFILYFLISMAAKNYRTHRHLYVVNKHRETSLKTFQTFVKGAGDDEQTKLHILLEAARTVFSPTNTGYMPSEDDNPNNRVIEILKMVKDSKP